MDEIYVLIKETPGSGLAPFHQLRIQRDVCELEEGPHPARPAPPSEASSHQSYEQYVSVVCKPPILHPEKGLAVPCP